VGQLTAQKLKKQTYSDTIKHLLDTRVVLPSKLISHIEEFKKENKISYRSKENFLTDSSKRLLKYYRKEIKRIKIRRKLYQKVETAIRELNLPFTDVNHFFEEQTDKLLEQYDQWKEQKEEEKS